MNIFYGIARFLFRSVNYIKRKTNLFYSLKQGMIVGEDSLFVGSQSFGTEPYLISIGKSCLITDGVKFITHDGSIQVPIIKGGVGFNEVYSKKSTFGRIFVGDNVFIGVCTIILPGTVIGRNSIVGAGAVVRGEYPEGVVIAGNPSKVICNVEEYYSRNKSLILNFELAENRKDYILRSLSNNGND